MVAFRRIVNNLVFSLTHHSRRHTVGAARRGDITAYSETSPGLSPPDEGGATVHWIKRLTGLSLAALLLLGGSAPAQAQFSINITVDETGKGTFTNTAGFQSALPSALLPD